MSLTPTDIKLFKPANISDTSSNGGVVTGVELFDVVGALFPNVDNSERLAGSTKWRKMFFKIHNDGIDPLIAARVFMDKDTGGSDTVMFVAGTTTDIQSGITMSPIFGVFPLSQSILAGAIEVKATLPTGIANPFSIGTVIRVTNKPTVGDAGDEDFVTVTGVTGSTGVITLDVSPAVNSSYTAATTKVACVYEFGDLVANVSDLVDASAGGTLDTSQIVCNNKASIDSVWTFSFTSATAFNVTSSVLGSVGTGNIITSTFSVPNATFSLPYFTIPNAAWGGTFTNGDTFNFTTNAATVPLWVKRVVPAGSTPTTVNRAVFVLDGGSI